MWCFGIVEDVVEIFRSRSRLFPRPLRADETCERAGGEGGGGGAAPPSDRAARQVPRVHSSSFSVLTLFSFFLAKITAARIDIDTRERE